MHITETTLFISDAVMELFLLIEGERMKRISLLLPDEDYKRIVLEAERLGVSVSDVIRMTLRQRWDNEQDGRNQK